MSSVDDAIIGATDTVLAGGVHRFGPRSALIAMQSDLRSYSSGMIIEC